LEGAAGVRVVVLFNQPMLPREHPEADSEQWVATTVEDMSSLLRATGFPIRFVAHESRAKNAVGFVRVALDWMMAVQLGVKRSESIERLLRITAKSVRLE